MPKPQSIVGIAACRIARGPVDPSDDGIVGRVGVHPIPGGGIVTYPVDKQSPA